MPDFKTFLRCPEVVGWASKPRKGKRSFRGQVNEWRIIYVPFHDRLLILFWGLLFSLPFSVWTRDQPLCTWIGHHWNQCLSDLREAEESGFLSKIQPYDIWYSNTVFKGLSLSVPAEWSSCITAGDTPSNVQNILCRATFPEWWEFWFSLQRGEMTSERGDGCCCNLQCAAWASIKRVRKALLVPKRLMRT